MHGGTVASVDAWVSETRREISEIVREVAAAVRVPRTEHHFFSFLADRMLRAMAGEGVVIWKRGHDDRDAFAESWNVVLRLGRITDESFIGIAADVHAALLVEVGLAGNPVVVPPTPGANQADVPANPARVPVAIVPIELDTSLPTNQPDASRGPVLADYLLEVFLDGEGGVATQRGYLRFVAQMADLAAEFLRSSEVRRLKRREATRRELEHVIQRIHDCYQESAIATILADSIAEIFCIDRVGVCQVRRSRAELMAVSYVGTIAQNSPAAEQIRQAALTPDDLPMIVDHTLGQDTAGTPLHVVWVAMSPASPTLRLVCLATAPERELDPDTRDAILYCLRHASLAIAHHARLNAVPGVRGLTALLTDGRISISGRRRVLGVVAILMFAAIIACFPVPLTVVAPGTLRPVELQNFCAARDAIVQEVHVHHGQRVVKGQPLVTLHDDALEQQITTLMGRRAVLIEQQTNWTQALVGTASHRLDRTGELQNERNLVAEELRGIDQQLALLEDVRRSLVIRCSSDGVVDAWKISQRLGGRPLRRGDYLLSTINCDSKWVVDAEVPQNRIARLQHSSREKTLELGVTLQTDASSVWPGSLKQIGPASSSPQRPVPANAVLIELSDAVATLLDNQQTSAPMNGSPVQVVCRCGDTSLAYALFQDAIVSLRSTYQMYFSNSLRLDPSDT